MIRLRIMEQSGQSVHCLSKRVCPSAKNFTVPYPWRWEDHERDNTTWTSEVLSAVVALLVNESVSHGGVAQKILYP